MKYTLKIFRGTKEKQYFEEFELELIEGANVISALMQIQKNPVNKQEKKTTPVVWEQGCLEEVCGACAMLVNSVPRQACTALIEPLLEKKSVITLAPLTKFELIKDLAVDRKQMFEDLKEIHAWIEADLNEKDFGPKINPKIRDYLYTLSTCMTCGCCTEACPQVNERSKFFGPAPISQVILFNSHPAGKKNKNTRLHSVLEEKGIPSCGNAQNCKEVCPKEIPLTESIAKMGRETTKYFFRKMFSKKEKK